MQAIDEKSDLIINTSDIFYYLFWIIMLTAKGTGLYEGMRQYNICLVIAMSCLIASLLFNEYTILELIWIGLLGSFGVWIYLHSKDQSALILVAVMVGLKNKRLDEIFFIGAIVWGACFVYMVIKTLIGAGDPGPILAHEKLGLGPILRWSLGYTHPNVLQITYVILACFILYIWNLKPKRKQWGITSWLMCGNIYVFLYSVSFTGFLFMTLLLLCNLYLQEKSKLLKVEKIGLQCIFPSCVLFSLLGPVLLQKEGQLFSIINKVLNSRFLATRFYLEELGITLLGRQIPQLSNFAVDCSYTEALLSYGIIFFGLIIAGYLFTIHDMVCKNRRKELAIMLSLLLAGISEPFLFNASFKNITVIFIGGYLFERSALIATNVKNSFLSRKLYFLHPYSKSFRISMVGQKRWWKSICAVVNSHKKRIIGVAVFSIVIFSVLGGILSEKPDSIYVGMQATDCADQDKLYLDKDDLPDNFNSIIYAYAGPDNALYEFAGNMLKIENLRKVVSAGIWGAMGVTVILILTISRRERKRAGENGKRGCQ